ncbi:hypothetical protein IKG33_00505 [Candidatus Saccharibacteria bacterium]|nr:hypothetical protein [Candidatus Saccharibacteria bacterium]
MAVLFLIMALILVSGLFYVFFVNAEAIVPLFVFGLICVAVVLIYLACKTFGL